MTCHTHVEGGEKDRDNRETLAGQSVMSSKQMRDSNVSISNHTCEGELTVECSVEWHT